MFKFSFPEFVRFLVNGTEEFADDQYVLTHQGVSYHWAPYWQECPVCSPLTRPDYIIHMETLDQDLATLLEDTKLSQHLELFPHTHTQEGGHWGPWGTWLPAAGSPAGPGPQQRQGVVGEEPRPRLLGFWNKTVLKIWLIDYFRGKIAKIINLGVSFSKMSEL